MKSVFTVLIIISSLLTFIGCGSKEMSKAKDYMDAQMYNEAISLLEIEIQANPKNVEAYYLAAQCYIELNNTRQSEEYFDKAILLDTDYSVKVGEYYYEKGFKLWKEKRYYSAQDYYIKAKKYYPEGREYFAQKLFDYATEISETETSAYEVTNLYIFVTNIDNKFNEDVAKQCAKLSNSLFEKGFYELSFEYGEFSIKYDPGFINSLAKLYQTYATKLLEVPDKSNEAINYFDRSIELNSSSRADIAKIYYDYSKKYESQNNAELTLLFAERCNNLDSNYEKYYNEIISKYISQLHSQDNKFQNYWKEFKRAIVSNDVNWLVASTRFPLVMSGYTIDRDYFIQDWESVLVLGGTKNAIMNASIISPTIGYDDKTVDLNKLKEIKRDLNLSEDILLYEFNVYSALTKFRFALVEGKIYLVAIIMLG
jgi:tetratricopeptide (TPR) repeat protein